MRLRKNAAAWALSLGVACAGYPRSSPAAAADVAAPTVTTPVPCIHGQPALLRVDLYADLSLPVEEPWQVIWNEVPISDAQLAWLADDDALLAEIRDGLDTRGPWVFAGMITAATGTALSSVGWALLGGAGDNHLTTGATLTMGLGGMVLAVAGLLVTADFMQAPMQPFMAPTPRHHLTRDRAEQLVLKVNRRFVQQACSGGSTTPTAPGP